MGLTKMKNSEKQQDTCFRLAAMITDFVTAPPPPRARLNWTGQQQCFFKNEGISWEIQCWQKLKHNKNKQ
jgi:hypothetical protein